MTPTDEFLGRRRVLEPRYRSIKYKNKIGFGHVIINFEEKLSGSKLDIRIKSIT